MDNLDGKMAQVTCRRCNYLYSVVETVAILGTGEEPTAVRVKADLYIDEDTQMLRKIQCKLSESHADFKKIYSLINHTHYYKFNAIL
jgi:hypothetical protein